MKTQSSFQHRQGIELVVAVLEEPIARSLLALFLALAVVFLVMPVLGANPLGAYSSLFAGAFGSKQAIGETSLAMTPLLISSLGFALAYKCGLFNIGLEGQIQVGAVAAAFVGYSIHGLPSAVHLPLALAASLAAGAIWGLGPAILKARFGIHEVISTIMMNYIAFKLSAYMVSVQGPMKDRLDLMPASPVIESSAKLARIMGGTRLTWGIAIALVAAFLVWFLLSKTRLGYKLRVVGQNHFAAEVGGIRASHYYVIAMMLSAGLGGLAGGVETLGVHYRLLASFSPGYGFDAIAVSLLGGLHPLYIIVSSFIFGALRSGAILMQAKEGMSKDIVQVISTVIIFVMSMADPLGRLIKRRIGLKTNA